MADQNTLIGIIYESVIIVIASTLLVFVAQRYREKKNRPTLLLLGTFTCYTLAILFSMIGKVFYYNFNGVPGEPGTFLYELAGRLEDFRISEALVIAAVYFSYVFKVKIFQVEYNKKLRPLVIAFGLVAAGYILIFYTQNDVLQAVIAFLLVLLYMCMVYLPFAARAIQDYQRIQEQKYRTSFLSLAILAIMFILVFVGFLLDRITILLGGPGYSVFYFLAWIFAIIGIISAYIGFIRPKAKEPGNKVEQ